MRDFDRDNGYEGVLARIATSDVEKKAHRIAKKDTKNCKSEDNEDHIKTRKI